MIQLASLDKLPFRWTVHRADCLAASSPLGSRQAAHFS